MFSHYASFHHITSKYFTSHYLSCHTIPHHTIPNHTTIAQHSTPHTNVPRHISQTVNVATHISPQTTIFYIWDHITLQSALTPPFHTTTSWSTFHITQPQSTSHTIPHPQLLHHTHIQHYSIIQTTTYSTLHYTTTSWFYITQPCIASFHNCTAHCICHILDHNSTPPHFTYNFPHFALCNIPHTRTAHSTQHHIPHHTFCNAITPCLKLQHSTLHHISNTLTSHFTSHHNSHQSLHHISAYHSTSCPHSTSHHAMHITFKCKLHSCPIAHIPNHTTHPHCISTIILHHTTMSNTASNHSISLGIPQPHFTPCVTTCTIFHMYHTIIPHRITTFTTLYRTYSTSHLIPHHSHIRNVYCGTTRIWHCKMFHITPMYNTLPLHLAPHHITTTFYIASSVLHQTPSLTF